MMGSLELLRGPHSAQQCEINDSSLAFSPSAVPSSGSVTWVMNSNSLGTTDIDEDVCQVLAGDTKMNKAGSLPLRSFWSSQRLMLHNRARLLIFKS